MRKKNMLSLLGWIISFQLIGYGIGLITQHNIDGWYQQLNKAPFNPPDIVFPIVWTLLYIMLAIVGWSIWQQHTRPEAKPVLFFFTLQMLMNWAWSLLFFQFHLITLSFYWLVAIIIFTLLTIYYARTQFFLVRIMLAPYLAWLLFAAYLNWEIVRLNV